MKKLQMAQRGSRQTEAGSRKKYPGYGILVLCLLLGCGIAVSAVLLGSGIGRFSREDTNVISLVPQEAESSKSEGKANKGTRYIAGRSDQYRGELQVHDDIQAWSSETWVDLFRSDYDGTVNSDDGSKVIAPGTSNFYNFTLKNNGNIPLDYSVSLKVGTYLGEQDTYSSIPLEWRLLSGDGTVLSDWQGYNERTSVLKQATLKVRHQDNYTVEWRWTFERGEDMDEEDTGMGNMAVSQPLGVNAAIYVYAEQSAGFNGKLPGPGNGVKTGDTSHILLYVVLLAVSACGLLILFVMNRRRKKDEDREDDQEGV